MPRALIAALALAVVTLPLASPVSAQSFGIGPRFSFVRGDIPSDVPSTRFLGGTIRLASSKRVSFELTLEQRTETSEDGTSRFRERPLQASMLIFPARGVFSPYLLAGYGLYQQIVDELNVAGGVVSTVSTRTSGWHAGAGAEIFLTRHAALYGDYRLRFVQFGEPAAGAEPIDIPFVDSVKVSHKGSMWTGGIAFYF